MAAPEEDEEEDEEEEKEEKLAKDKGADKSAGADPCWRHRRRVDNVPSRAAFFAPTDEERQLARSGQLAVLLKSTAFETSLSGGGVGLAALTSP